MKHRSCIEIGESAQRMTISAALNQSGLYGTVASHKQAAWSLSASIYRTMRTWAKRPFGQNFKHYVWQTPGSTHNLDNTIPTVKCDGSIMLWKSFSVWGTASLIRIEGWINEAACREVKKSLEGRRRESGETVHLSAWQLPKAHSQEKTVATYKQLCDRPWVAEPNQDLNPTEHLWRDLSMTVHRYPSHPVWFARSCQKEWSKLPKTKCAKLVETHLRDSKL